FDDPVYLHQVVERGPDGLVRYNDLCDAFAAAKGEVAGREWRVHFHVPVFMERLTPFASTQSFIRDVLAMHRVDPVSRHLEVETYTWGVLPDTLRSTAVDEAVARELAWVRTELSA
ncbi:MAG: sugar phosphate isomerase, partial [Burkholderiaceae bacterium]|nr:sugar phosphate isomerase [Burkholderiaceae bacterium]